MLPELISNGCDAISNAVRLKISDNVALAMTAKN